MPYLCGLWRFANAYVESTLGGADINETLESAKAEIEAIGK